jgi:hypothetical protein
MTIAPQLGILFHRVLYCWNPPFKILLRMHKNETVTLLVSEKNKKTFTVADSIVFCSLTIPIPLNFTLLHSSLQDANSH